MIERKFVCQKHSHRFKKMVTQKTIDSGMTRCIYVDDDLLKQKCGSMAWLIRSEEKETKLRLMGLICYYLQRLKRELSGCPMGGGIVVKRNSAGKWKRHYKSWKYLKKGKETK